MTSDERSKYWEEYYGTQKKKNEDRMPPSQFAAFCRIEFINYNINQIIEIASGDGRDSFFFEQQGMHVFASDKSATAVDMLEAKASTYERIRVMKIDALSSEFPTHELQKSACAYYARFFIHTLDEDQLLRFFKNLSKSMRQNDYFFTEYRNIKDEALDKVTPDHFRKFFKADFVSKIANENDLKCIYEVEGRGFSKWSSDDAFVTRQIYVKKDG
jgi:hypothetical protein